MLKHAEAHGSTTKHTTRQGTARQAQQAKASQGMPKDNMESAFRSGVAVLSRQALLHTSPTTCADCQAIGLGVKLPQAVSLDEFLRVR